MSRSRRAAARQHAHSGAAAAVAPERAIPRSGIESRWLPTAPTLVAVTVVALAVAVAPARAAERSPARFASSGSSSSTTVLLFGSGEMTPAGSGAVRALQRRLAMAGYSSGRLDGRFGPLTELAVRRFQASQGLVVDGVAGPRTLAAATRPTLSLGAGCQPDGSALVRAVQDRLASAGDAPGPLDGCFGLRTELAVRRFQASRGLRVDGIVGPLTAARLGTRSRSRARRTGPLPRTRHPASRPGRSRSTSPPPSGISHSSGAPAPALIVGLAIALGLGLLVVLRLRRGRGGHRATVPGPAAWSVQTEASSGTEPPIQPAPEAAVQEPDDVERIFLLGVQLEERNDLAGAQEAFAYADRRGHAAAASNLGVLLDRKGDLDGAEAAYGRADQRGEPVAGFNLGALLEERGELDRARAAYRRAADRGEPSAAFRLGELLEQHGDLVGAEKAYVCADDRGHGAAASKLGALLAKRGDLADAERAYRRAADRGEAAGALLLGALLERRGDRVGAVAAYKQAHDADQGHVARTAEYALLELGEPTGAEP